MNLSPSRLYWGLEPQATYNAGAATVQQDEELALGLQQGRKDDLAVLVQRHYSPLVGYLYRMTGGDRMQSEDMAQETFLRALRGIASYTYPRPFKPWLYAIATNLARNHHMRAETRQTLTAETDTTATSEFEAIPVDAPLPEAELIAGETEQESAQAVARALAALPDHHREVVVLRYYQEWSLAEIAEALSIPVGTVKSRLSLGLRGLRTQMRPNLGESLEADDAR
ncbi:MAG: RNA polymerase sigma factor [bacterium]|nr:RNA polymerase sigma factor [bacterium]